MDETWRHITKQTHFVWLRSFSGLLSTWMSDQIETLAWWKIAIPVTRSLYNTNGHRRLSNTSFFDIFYFILQNAFLFNDQRSASLIIFTTIFTFSYGKRLAVSWKNCRNKLFSKFWDSKLLLKKTKLLSYSATFDFKNVFFVWCFFLI